MNIPDLFFEQNERGIELEREEEVKETPLPAGYLTDIAKVTIQDSPTFPLSLLIAAGAAVKNAEVVSISNSSESEEPAVTFSCDNNSFKVRELVLILNSKLQVLTRGTILESKESVIKVLPESELDDFQHYVIVRCGSEIVHERNMQMIRTLKTGSYPERKLPDSAIEFLERLFGGKETRQFRQCQGNSVINVANLNESECKAAGLIVNSQPGELIVIEGPPGTGKTTTLAAAIEEYLKTHEKARILISAASNIAVDNLLVKLNFKNALRIGSVARVTQESCEEYLLDCKISDNYKNELRDLQKDVFSLEKQLEKARKQATKTGSRKELMEIRYELRKAGQTLHRASQIYQNDILQTSRVVAATLSGCESAQMLKAVENTQFDLVVVDEAAQALDINLAAAISHCAGALVLCGDPMQLPPTLLSNDSEPLWKFAIPVMRKLCAMHEKQFDFVMLDTSYRFGDLINDFPSQEFYSGELKINSSVPVQFNVIDDDNVIFIDTAGLELEESAPDGEDILKHLSLKNDGEAEICASVCRRLLQEYEPCDIGVITPYAAQCSLLHKMLESECQHGLEISTVDGFQGREKLVIVFSLVRSNDDGEIGFLRDERRLNVSITRAKEQLVVIGDSLTLEDKGTVGKWVRWMQDNCSCISGSEFE